MRNDTEKRISPVLMSARRRRDIAFLEQLELAQYATRRDANRDASADVTHFVALVRQAIGARMCSLDDVCRAVMEVQPTGSVLDELPAEDTPAESPFAVSRIRQRQVRARRRSLLARLIGRFCR